MEGLPPGSPSHVQAGVISIGGASPHRSTHRSPARSARPKCRCRRRCSCARRLLSWMARMAMIPLFSAMLRASCFRERRFVGLRKRVDGQEADRCTTARSESEACDLPGFRVDSLACAWLRLGMLRRRDRRPPNRARASRRASRAAAVLALLDETVLACRKPTRSGLKLRPHHLRVALRDDAFAEPQAHQQHLVGRLLQRQRVVGDEAVAARLDLRQPGLRMPLGRPWRACTPSTVSRPCAPGPTPT